MKKNLQLLLETAGGEKQPLPIDMMLKYKAASVSGLSFGIAARSAPGDKFFPPGSFSAFISYEPKSRIVRKMRLGAMSVQLSMSDMFRLSSVRVERGTDYPFARSVSLSVGITF